MNSLLFTIDDSKGPQASVVVVVVVVNHATASADVACAPHTVQHTLGALLLSSEAFGKLTFCLSPLLTRTNTHSPKVYLCTSSRLHPKPVSRIKVCRANTDKVKSTSQVCSLSTLKHTYSQCVVCSLTSVHCSATDCTLIATQKTQSTTFVSRFQLGLSLSF